MKWGQLQVIEYLNGLTGKAREDAERYIRKAPSQIATKYRQSIESRLGWTPSDAFSLLGVQVNLF